MLASAVLVHHKHTGIARVRDPRAVRRPGRILQVSRPHRQPLHVRAIRPRRIDIRRRRPTAYKGNPPHSTRKGRQSRRHRHTNKTHNDQNEQAPSVHAETPRDSSRRGRARRLVRTETSSAAPHIELSPNRACHSFFDLRVMGSVVDGVNRFRPRQGLERQRTSLAKARPRWILSSSQASGFSLCGAVRRRCGRCARLVPGLIRGERPAADRRLAFRARAPGRG